MKKVFSLVFLILFVGLGASAVPEPLIDVPLNGSTPEDYSANNYQVTSNGNPQQNGEFWDFDGNDDVLIVNGSENKMNGGATIYLEIKPDNFPPTDAITQPLTKADLFTFTYGHTGSSFVKSVNSKLGDSSFSSAKSTTNFQAGSVYEVAGVYNQTHLSIFINGTKETSTPVSNSIDWSLEDKNEVPWTIGGFYRVGDDDISKNFDGSIRNVLVYNDSLTDSEIQSINDPDVSYTVRTQDADNISSSSAVLKGDVANLTSSSADVGFYYKKKTESSWAKTSPQSISLNTSFQENVTELSSSTSYEFKAFFESSQKNRNGTVKEFTTGFEPKKYSALDGELNMDVNKETRSHASGSKVYVDLYNGDTFLKSIYFKTDTGQGVFGDGDLSLTSTSVNNKTSLNYREINLTVSDSDVGLEQVWRVQLHNDGFFVQNGFTGNGDIQLNTNYMKVKYPEDYNTLSAEVDVTGHYDAEYGQQRLSDLSTGTDYSLPYTVQEQNTTATQILTKNWFAQIRYDGNQVISVEDLDETQSSTVSKDFFYDRIGFFAGDNTTDMVNGQEKVLKDVIRNKKPDIDYKKGTVMWTWATYGNNPQYSTLTDYADFGDQHNVSYQHVTRGWTDAFQGNLGTTKSGLGFPNDEVSSFSQYAHDRNQSSVLWATWEGIKDYGISQTAETFANQHNADGVKDDFITPVVQENNQDSIAFARNRWEWYNATYNNGLIVNTHGGTNFVSHIVYPNLVANEMVKGGEADQQPTITSLNSYAVSMHMNPAIETTPFKMDKCFQKGGGCTATNPGTAMIEVAPAFSLYGDIIVVSSSPSELNNYPNVLDLLDEISYTGIETRNFVMGDVPETTVFEAEMSDDKTFFATTTTKSKSFSIPVGEHLPAGEYNVKEWYSASSSNIETKSSTVTVDDSTVYSTEPTLEDDGNLVRFEPVQEDTTPPTSSDNWSDTGFVDKSEATVEISASDTGGSGVADIYYRVNGGTYTTVAGSSATVTISSQGNNSLEYYAEDSAGNTEATQTEYVALSSKPLVTIHNPVNKLFSSTVVDLNVSSNQDIQTWEYSLNDNTKQTFTPNTTLTGLGDKTHTLEVYATNQQGATGSSSVSFETQPLNFDRTVDTFKDGSFTDSTPFQWEKFRSGEARITQETLILDHPTNDGSVVSTNNRISFADCCTGVTSHWQVGEAITMNLDAGFMANFDGNGFVALKTKGGADGEDLDLKIQPVTNSDQLNIITKETSSGKSTDLGLFNVGSSETWETGFILEGKNPTEIKYFVQGNDGDYVVNDTVSTSVPADDYVADGIAVDSQGSGDVDISFQVNNLAYKPYVRGNTKPIFNPPGFGISLLSTDDATQEGNIDLTVGEQLQVQVNSSDPDGNFDNLTLQVFKDGTEIFKQTSSQSDILFNNITEITSATYDATVTLRDQKGLTNTDSVDETVTEDTPVINLQSPGDGETLTFKLNDKNKKNVEFDFQIEDNNNFDGSYSILLNGSSIKTGSFTASEFNSNDELNVQTFADVSPGTYNHTLQVTNSETGNTFVSSGNLGQTTFTVEGAEAKPSFKIDSPSEGETVFYNENNRNDANLTVSGNVDTTFSGNADVLLDGATVAAFNFDNGTTSYSESFTAANGSHNVKISLTSDTTGTVYNSSTRSFTVEGVDEVPPEITVTQPDLNADADRLDEAFDYNVTFDSEINGTAEIFLRHNNGSKIGIIQDNLDISPGVRTETGSFTIPSQFRYVGTYEIVGQVNSSKGNVYDSKNTLFILPETSFRDLQPNDTTVKTGGDSNATVTLSGVAEISADGTLQIQVKQPGDSAFNTVTTKQFTGFGKDRSYNVDAKFTDITYPEINGNRSTSKDYQYRVKYILDDETAKGVTEAYTSDSKAFRFSKEAEGVFTRTLKQATNIVSTAVPPIFGLLALGASIFATSRETDSNIAIIVVALTVSGILIRLGLFPFFDMITGLPGLLVLLGVLLYLANNMGEVIS